MASAQAELSTNGSDREQYLILHCIEDRSSLISIEVYAVLNVLLFPLYVLVLFVGFKQWLRHQHRGALSGSGTSDVLTFHLALVEVIGCFSAVAFTLSSLTKSMSALSASYCLFVMYFFGEAMFHCGICLDRYLAVVHPISYRKQKEARAVFIRNVTVFVGWLCVVVWTPYVRNLFPEFAAKELVGTLVIFNLIVAYCCLAALYVLTRPGPNGKKDVDVTKLRAFHIILSITCLLFFKMIGILTYLILFILRPLNPGQLCLTLITSVIVITPVNVLIPMLFLRRVKKTVSRSR